MKHKTMIFAFVFVIFSFIGCKTVQDHRGNVHSQQDREMTVGTVQKEIRKGMSGADVAQALGSPNIVTKDESGDETWVYDKIATEASYSQSSSVLFLVLFGMSENSGAAATTQKTLTVVIKFDADSKVKSFSYHSSKF